MGTIKRRRNKIIVEMDFEEMLKLALVEYRDNQLVVTNSIFNAVIMGTQELLKNKGIDPPRFGKVRYEGKVIVEFNNESMR